jgi:hypothetical protein
MGQAAAAMFHADSAVVSPSRERLHPVVLPQRHTAIELFHSSKADAQWQIAVTSEI